MACISRNNSGTVSALRPSIPTSLARSFFSVFCRCAAHHDPAQRLPPSIMIGIGAQSQSPHDRRDTLPVFADCVAMQRGHVADELGQLVPPLPVTGDDVDPMQGSRALIEVAAGLAQLAEDLREEL